MPLLYTDRTQPRNPVMARALADETGPHPAIVGVIARRFALPRRRARLMAELAFGYAQRDPA